MSERHDGRRLEDLVQGIEGHLLGEGFDVETRVEIFGEGGVQTAELDIRVTGRVGSSSIHWVFECRDRPSSGPEGIDWIEQLVGRRARVGADKLFAVSTTGFTAPARAYADEQGIVLRTVTTIEDIENDFIIEGIVLFNTYVSEFGIFDIDVDDATASPRIETRTMPKNAAEIRPANSDEPFRGLADYLDATIRPPERQDDADAYPLTSKRIFATERPMELRMEGAVLRTKRLRIPYTLTTERVTSRAVAGRLYAEGDRVIGREGDFEVPSPSGTIKLRTQLLPKQDGSLDVRIIGDTSGATFRSHNWTVEAREVSTSNEG